MFMTLTRKLETSKIMLCLRFYRCVKFNQADDDYFIFEFDCPAGLAFKEDTETCAWPGSISTRSSPYDYFDTQKPQPDYDDFNTQKPELDSQYFDNPIPQPGDNKENRKPNYNYFSSQRPQPNYEDFNTEKPQDKFNNPFQTPHYSQIKNEKPNNSGLKKPGSFKGQNSNKPVNQNSGIMSNQRSHEQLNGFYKPRGIQSHVQDNTFGVHVDFTQQFVLSMECSRRSKICASFLFDGELFFNETLLDSGVGYNTESGVFTTHCPGLYQLSYFYNGDVKLTLRQKPRGSETWYNVISKRGGKASSDPALSGNIVLLRLALGDQ
ncbi:unnamed protein product, partial [Trichogramma brassicae]